MMHTHNCLHWQRCFRPLSGNYISQWSGNKMLKKYDYEGFRPLSGNYISQKSQKKICLNSQVSFRPLSGNYISQFTVGKPHVLLFKKNVSVPCRGTTFLKIRRPFDDEFPGVSVPCRGTTFLKISSEILCRRLPITCFRPLSGNYISQCWQ